MPQIPLNSPLPTPDFSIDNLRKIISGKKNTAPSPSLSSWKSLKHTNDNLLHVLSENYKAIYELNYIPTDWKYGNTILLEKPTKDIGLDKFRPITLLSVEYKLYSHILNETLNKILTTHNIIPLSQNGFVPNRGSDQCLHTLINVIRHAKNKNNKLFCLYIDLAKAFDSVEHWVLKDILQHINIGKLGNAVFETLKNTYTHIETAHGWTEYIEFLRGTKQGDIISPTIFVLFIAPLLWTLDKSNLGYNFESLNTPALAIADDIALISDNKDNISTLFQMLLEYTNITGMKIKPNKSAAAYRGDSGFIPVINNMAFTDLGCTRSYRYLGVYINLELDWQDQMDASETCYRNTVDLILNKYYLSCNQHIALINSMAVSALAYRMQVIIFNTGWLEKLQRSTIYKISKTHALFTYFIDPDYWYLFKGLTNLWAHNIAIFLSNIFKNLNKPNLIAYSFIFERAKDFNSLPEYIDEYSHYDTSLIKSTLHLINIDLLYSPLIKDIAIYISRNNIPRPLTTEYIHFLNNTYKFSSKDIMYTLPPTPLPIPTFTTQNLIIFSFSDGSLDIKNNKMAYAFKHTLNITNTTTKSVHGPLNSLEPELQGLEETIREISSSSTLYAFVDSKASIDSICNFPKLNTNQILKTTNRNSLRRIHNLINDKNWNIIHITSLPNVSLPGTLYLYHIHSHMIDNQKKRSKYLDLHKTALKELTNAVIKGNALVDKAASYAVHYSENNAPLLLTEGHDMWQLFDHNTNTPIYKNAKKFIYKAITDTGLNNLIKNKPALSKRLINPITSIKYTIIIFKSKKSIFNRTADFMQRIIDKSLPTRNRIFLDLKKNKPTTSNNDKKDNIKKQANLIARYNHPYCIPCLYLDNHKHFENNAHIFTNCPHYNNINNTLAEELLTIINNFVYPEHINNMPFWFSTHNTCFPQNNIEEEILNFPKDLGDMGYIPNKLKEWINYWFPKLKNKNKLIKKLALTTQTFVHNKWLTRCDIHFALINSPFVLPNLPHTLKGFINPGELPSSPFPPTH